MDTWLSRRRPLVTLLVTLGSVACSSSGDDGAVTQPGSGDGDQEVPFEATAQDKEMGTANNDFESASPNSSSSGPAEGAGEGSETVAHPTASAGGSDSIDDENQASPDSSAVMGDASNHGEDVEQPPDTVNQDGDSTPDGSSNPVDVPNPTDNPDDTLPDSSGDVVETPVDPVVTKAPLLIDELLPSQEWPKLGASEVGILWEPFDAAWPGLDIGRQPRSEGSTLHSYTFSTGGSPYVLYFESTGPTDGYNFLDDWRVPNAQDGESVFDAAMFGPEDLNRWGITKPAHLVRLTVNGGDGSGGTLHFVATDGEVLDSTEQYPIDVTEALTTAAESAAAWLAASDYEPLLEESAEQTRLEGGATQLVGRTYGFWPTWDQSSETLRVSFIHYEQHAWSLQGDLIPPPACPDGAPCAQFPPTYALTTYSYGVEQGIVYEVDKAGTFINETLYEPRPLPQEKRESTIEMNLP